MENKKKLKKKIKIVDDLEDTFKIEKKFFNLPLRGIIVGKSGFSGKTLLLLNLLCRPYDESDVEGEDFYKHDFDGQNVYIISPSIHVDHKIKMLIDFKNIPFDNVYEEYDEDRLNVLYDSLEADYVNSLRQGKKPCHKLIIFDDCAFDGSFKRKNYGVISKLFCNGRHIAISTILTAQKYSQIPTVVRTNSTFAVLYKTSNYELKAIEQDHGVLDTAKDFRELFHKVTNEKFSFFIVNYQKNLGEGFYLDSNFEPVDTQID